MKNGRLRINEKIVTNLEDALEHARAGADPQSHRCAIAPEHREAMSLYLKSWVIGPLAKALGQIKRNRIKEGESV